MGNLLSLVRENTTGGTNEDIQFIYDEKGQEECPYCQKRLRYRRCAVLGLRLFPHLEPCPCEGAVSLRRAKAAEEEGKQAEEKFQRKTQRIEELFRQSRLGGRFRGRTFDNFIVMPHNRKAFEAALEYAREFADRREKGEGLFFTGGTGTGKSHLAAAIANNLLQELTPVVFADITRLLGGLKAAITGKSSVSEQHLIDRLCQVDLLVIDDLGKEKPSEWVEEKLYTIVNARYEDYKPIIITSNFSLDGIEARLEKNGKAIASRLVEVCRGVKLDGPDYRKSVNHNHYQRRAGVCV
jgi:DNA replication protein DnaC